jgi:hypothetical protein
MKNLIFALAFIFSVCASAEEFYRQKLPVQRFAGADQGNVTSCQAESETAALESAFAERGFSIRLSSFYQHARIYQKRIEAMANEEEKALARTKGKVRYNSEDIALLNRMGDVVPYYMLPDDTTGYSPRRTGTRPNLSKIMAPDASFVAVTLTRKSMTFLPGYTNSGATIEQMKAYIKSGEAIILDYFPHLMMSPYSFFDERTGLMKKDKLLKDAPYDEASHGSAIVGFDDSLYADYGFSTPGAFIIKNSWNDDDRRLEAFGYDKPDALTLAALKSMRYKLSRGGNLPGYYAIPYEFIKMTVSRGKYIGYTLLQMDYAKFANQYFTLQPDYKVVIAPYMCGLPYRDVKIATAGIHKLMANISKTYARLMADSHSATAAADDDELVAFLKAQVQPRDDTFFGIKQFRFAYFSQHEKSGVDRLRDFYSGAFNDYYCFGGQGEEFNQPDYVYPNLSFYVLREYRDSLTELSKDNKGSANWAGFLRTLFEQEIKK